MRHRFLLVLGLALLGCGRPHYTWRTAPNAVNTPIALRIQTQFDPKAKLTPEAQKLYVDSIHEALSSWAEILPEAEPAKEGDITLRIRISCACRSEFARQADATMELASLFDRDRPRPATRNPEAIQRDRLGYDADDMQGDIRIYGRATAAHPYTSIFMKAHLMAFMDPLSGDAKLVAANRAREQARGLARWIIADLQRIDLLPREPIR
ncbi:hypothetical protein [Geothrix sp. SG200]|uniref:hypothetical protein n=1 Tax=Geothrix sp. SG200 TaxID=2922865 RepID=UPI001FAD357E|nr:hypothetical protein [Geothrix sp. SG200]